MAVKLNHKVVNMSLHNVVAGNFEELYVYDGDPPDVNVAPTGTLLVVIEAEFDQALDGTSGTAVLGVGPFSDNALAEGTASYARFMGYFPGGDIWLQGSAGTSADCEFVLDKEIFSVSEEVTFTACTACYPDGE